MKFDKDEPKDIRHSEDQSEKRKSMDKTSNNGKESSPLNSKGTTMTSLGQIFLLLIIQFIVKLAA